MDQFLWIGWIVWFVFTFIQIYQPTNILADDWYSRVTRNKKYAPPKEAVFCIWIIFYALMSVSISLFWQSSAYRTDANYDAVIAMYVVTIVLGKIWFFTLFQIHMILFSLVIVLLVTISAVVVFSLFIIDGAVISAVFFGIYVLWLIYNTALNLDFYMDNETKNTIHRIQTMRAPSNSPFLNTKRNTSSMSRYSTKTEYPLVKRFQPGEYLR